MCTIVAFPTISLPFILLQAISCDVLENSGELLSCFLEVDGILAGNGSLQLPYLSASGSFVPSLPLLFGQVTGGNGSLVRKQKSLFSLLKCR